MRPGTPKEKKLSGQAIVQTWCAAIIFNVSPTYAILRQQRAAHRQVLISWGVIILPPVWDAGAYDPIARAHRAGVKLGLPLILDAGWP